MTKQEKSFLIWKQLVEHDHELGTLAILGALEHLKSTKDKLYMDKVLQTAVLNHVWCTEAPTLEKLNTILKEVGIEIAQIKNGDIVSKDLQQVKNQDFEFTVEFSNLS